MSFTFNPFTGNFDVVITENSTVIEVTQPSHGFSIGNALYFDGTDWQLAQSDDIETLGIGIVSKTKGTDIFIITIAGLVEGLSGLTAGEYYYVSDTTAGLLTTTAGTNYVNPIFQALSTTTGIVLPFRADEGTGLLSGLTTQSDWDSTNLQYLYVGNAESGSATSSAVWRISRTDFSQGGLIEYADGNQNFDNIYDNKEALSYS